MATAVFTTVEARVDQILSNAIWADEVKDNLNQLASAHRNLLTNGGFEIWQRGAGGFTANLAYTADRWQLSISTGTATVTQETGIIDGSAAALKIVTVGTVSQTINQKIENLAELRGKTIALSLRVYQSVASAVLLRIGAAGGSVDSATSATTGAFVTLTVGFTVGGADAGPLLISVVFSAAGTFYLDNAMLVIGPAPAPYRPLHPQEDMARCQRYYEVHGGANPSMAVAGYGAAGATATQTVSLNTFKAGVPTLTKNGTWGVSNCGQPSVAAPTQTTYALSTVITALGTFSYSGNSSDDTLSIEYNP